VDKSLSLGLAVPRLNLIHIVIHSPGGWFHRLFRLHNRFRPSVRLERLVRAADVSRNGGVASPAYDLACYAIVFTDIYDMIQWMDHQGAITSWLADAIKKEGPHGEDLL